MMSLSMNTLGRGLALVWAGLLGAAPVAGQQPGEVEPLTLARAVALAQETHPSVRAARANEAAADAGVGLANAAWYPQLALGASLTQYEEPWLAEPIHSFRPTLIPEFDETLLRGTLSLGWTLFDGGARTGRIRGARAGEAGAAAARSATEQALTARVAIAYLAALTARGVLEAEESAIEALQAERHRVELLLGEGRAARVELLRVDAALAAAEAERVATLARLDLAERNLARLIDRPVELTRAARLEPVRLVEEAALAERPALLERAITASPQLEAARQRVRATEAERQIAKAAWWPVVDVFGAYLGYGSNATDPTAEWQAGIELKYPIFSGGARAKAVSEASARADAVREELRSAELGAEEETDRALNAAIETRARVEALSRAVQHQAEVVRIERLSLEAGAGTQTDYLRAEADLLGARSRLVEARHAEIAARVELARVVGELDSEWLKRNLETAE
jgi:outer membrane protein TolC